MAAKENTYEKQATLSLACAAAAGLVVLVFAFQIVMKFQWQEFEVLLGQKRYYAMLGMCAFAILIGTAGFFLGFNSAGQKRNKKNSWAWTGFFLNAAILTLAMSGLLFFWFTKEVLSSAQ